MSLQSTDQIADLITRIRNAIMVNKNEIVVPASKLKIAVLEADIESAVDAERIVTEELGTRGFTYPYMRQISFGVNVKL